MTTAQTIIDVDAIDCRFDPRPWPFALDRAAEIDQRWQRSIAEKPAMFNGRVLLLHRGEVETRPDGRTIFRGAYLETDFKAFLAWRDLGCPPAGVRNGFGMAALSGVDGAFMLGEMNAHTANAGLIYFASGTPDPNDIVGQTVDIAGSILRELAEETGILAHEVETDPGFTMVIDEHRVGFMKRVRSAETSDALKARIEAFLATEAEPELVRMHVIRTVQDIGPAVQVSCAAYLHAVLKADLAVTDPTSSS